MDDIVERAIMLATGAHSGQVDKNGEPYILHPLRVMLAVPPRATLRVVGVMHDVLEDTEVTADMLRMDGWSDEIVDALIALSRRDGETYDDFIQRIRRNAIAREVKPYDLEDNLRPDRLNRLDPVERRAKFRRYTAAQRTLR